MVGQIKVLVVDDSLLMRKVVTDVLNQNTDIEVVGVAMDGDFALMKLGRLNPDVIVLDINMPRMDGLTALKIINEQFHIPTIILSAFTREGAFTTLQALKYGAIDFICKPDEGSVTANQAYLQKNLVDKIKIAYQIHQLKASNRNTSYETRRLSVIINKEMPEFSSPSVDTSSPIFSNLEAEKLSQLQVNPPANIRKIVAIGASTGGTIAVEKIIRALPANFPGGIVVVQHMPKDFTAAFAETLNNNSALQVTEARDGQEIMSGQVYIAPGDAHMQIRRVNTQYLIQLDRITPPVNGLRPSVDMLFYSLAANAGKKAIGVILTGMGKDGAFGVRALKKTGAHTIAQDELSCVIFGMPKEAIKTGCVDQVLSLNDIPSWLILQMSKEEAYSTMS